MIPDGQQDPVGIANGAAAVYTFDLRKRSGRVALLSTVTIGVSAAVAILLTGCTDNRSRSSAAHSDVSPAAHLPSRSALDPASFAPGACVAFAPLSGNRHRTVFLDAGHGGPDPGGLGVTGSGQQIQEKTETLATVRDATQLLRAEGYRVVVSRTGDTAVARMPGGHSRSGMSVSEERKDLLARVRCANLAGAAALVSVHFDVDGNRSTRGAGTFFDAARPFSSRNRTLAVLLQRNILAALAAHGGHAPDRGATSNSTGGGALTPESVAYGHLLLIGPYKRGHNDHPSTMPGALVEPLFISNPADGSLANSAPGQHALATGIAGALEQFLAR